MSVSPDWRGDGASTRTDSRSYRACNDGAGYTSRCRAGDGLLCVSASSQGYGQNYRQERVDNGNAERQQLHDPISSLCAANNSERKSYGESEGKSLHWKRHSDLDEFGSLNNSITGLRATERRLGGCHAA